MDQEAVKRAFLVVGPESSGTRFLTRLFIACGCLGDGGHYQRLDSYFSMVPGSLKDVGEEGISIDIDGVDLLVWRRSLPHGGREEWPDLRLMIKALRRRGFEVWVVVILRDWLVTAKSQVRRGMAASVDEALERIHRSVLSSLEAIKHESVAWHVVLYESLVLHPHSATSQLFKHLDLTLPAKFEKPVDMNLKYYGN